MQRSSLLFGGQNLFTSLPRQLFCTRILWRKGWIVTGWYDENDEFIPLLHIALVQNSLRRKELNKFCPPNSSDDPLLLFCILILLLWCRLLGPYVIALILELSRAVRQWRRILGHGGRRVRGQPRLPSVIPGGCHLQAWRAAPPPTAADDSCWAAATAPAAAAAV